MSDPTESLATWASIGSFTAVYFSATSGNNTWTGTTTIRTRKNGGAGGSSVTFNDTEDSVTKYDTSGSDTLVDGNTFNYEIDMGAGSGTFNLESAQVWLRSTSDQFLIATGDFGGERVNANLTTYFALGGEMILISSESAVEMTAPFDMTITAMQVLSDRETMTGNSVVTLRKNGVATALAVTFSNVELGHKEDTGAISVTGGTDVLSTQIVTGTGTNRDFNYIVYLATGGAGGGGGPAPPPAPSPLTTDLLTEMRGLNRVVATAELTLGGTVYRYSAKAAVDSDSIGGHSPTLLSMSEFTRSANYSEFSLEIPSPSIEIFDHDRTLQKLLGGPLRGAVDGSPVACWRRSKHVAAAEHYKFFDGLILNHGLSRDRTYRFTLSPDTSVLDGNPKIPYLTRADFPSAPLKFLNQPLWIVFGIHSSTGVADAKGMVQCLPSQVDSAGDCTDWIVSYGQSVGVQRLFRGASQSDAVEDTSNWGFYPLERGPHRYQMAHYSGATKPKAEDYVAVDLNGLFRVGPVAIANPAITNPAECIRVFLAHFAYGSGDVRSSVAAYESEAGKPIAAEVFDDAEAYFSARGDKCAMVIRADEKILDVLNGWCDDFNAGPLWDADWRIGAIPEDESETGIYFEDRHVRQDVLDALGPIQADNSRSTPVSEVLVNYLLADSLGSLVSSGTVRDPTAAKLVREDFNLESGKAEAF